MIIQILLFVTGLLALYFGAEWLVRGAARLARRLGVSPLVVGLTIVAFGTSSPELVVSILAAARGQADVALGNVVGSNIVNIAVILGAAALVHPLRAEMRIVVRETPIMIVAALLLGLMGLDGDVSRTDGFLLFLGFVAYVAFVLRAAPRESAAVQAEFAEFERAESLTPLDRTRGADALLILGGLAGLALGAHLLVGSALYFAHALGIPEIVIAVTVVAIGTSLPELATTVLAAVRHESDIAIGNIVGSNVFNVLAILGIASLVHPVAVHSALLRFEVPVMIGLSIVFAGLIATRLRLERWEGILLLAGYAAFAAALIVRTP